MHRGEWGKKRCEGWFSVNATFWGSMNAAHEKSSPFTDLSSEKEKHWV
jgi:hypothetical protein